ncbi:hypothetical protein AYO50_00480 [Acidobacteria bacterium SCGC AG-212-P17]|nr:hypothetical protein AYO50_00480 [Acidobacteria bacterium SCGC AG-212-P17]
MSDLFIVTLDARWMGEICFLGSMCSAKMAQPLLMPQKKKRGPSLRPKAPRAQRSASRLQRWFVIGPQMMSQHKMDSIEGARYDEAVS